MDQSITVPKALPLYDEIVWLMRAQAISPPTRLDGIQYLCLKILDDSRIRITGTNAKSLHSIVVPKITYSTTESHFVNDKLNVPEDYLNENGQYLFRPIKSKDDIICMFVRNPPKFPQFDGVMPSKCSWIGTMEYSNQIGSVDETEGRFLRRLYRFIDGVKPEWNYYLHPIHLHDLCLRSYEWDAHMSSKLEGVIFTSKDIGIERTAMIMPEPLK